MEVVMRILFGASALATVAAASAADVPPAPPPVAIHHPTLPKGATMVGKTPFATIFRVPPSPTDDVQPQRQNYRTVSEWYAQEEGLPLEEAKERLSEQMGIQPIFERLQERLRKHEPDNYVSARLVHQPDWAYVLYFKRDPEATLRKYHVNPRFKAARAAYTEAELKTLVDPWLKRFAGKRIGSGYFPFAAEGRAEIMMTITAAEYRAIAARDGWGDVPPPLQLSFAKDLPFPRIDPLIAPLLRGFASESQATGLQMQRGESGRVILDDGCLRLAAKSGKKGPLVVFHRETGIGFDAQGYLATIDRQTGNATGRIGEMWSWAGPNPGEEFDGLAELKAACGDGPIANVGNPESEARFKARHPGY
jgi:hypothetical protein